MDRKVESSRLPDHLKMNGDTETVCAAYKATQRGEA